jgi:hypothetical protein
VASWVVLSSIELVYTWGYILIVPYVKMEWWLIAIGKKVSCFIICITNVSLFLPNNYLNKLYRFWARRDNNYKNILTLHKQSVSASQFHFVSVICPLSKECLETKSDWKGFGRLRPRDLERTAIPERRGSHFRSDDSTDRCLHRIKCVTANRKYSEGNVV